SCHVIPTTAVHGQGVNEIIAAVRTASTPDLHLDYPEPVESAVTAISARLNDTPISPRSLALMWLSRDPVSETWMKANLDQDVYQELCAQRDTLQQSFAEPLSMVIQQVRL